MARFYSSEGVWAHIMIIYLRYRGAEKNLNTVATLESSGLNLTAETRKDSGCIYPCGFEE